MKKVSINALLGLILFSNFVVSALGYAGYQAPEDPFGWLEDIYSNKALEWVHRKNQQTFDVLESDPRFLENEKLAREIILAQDRIPEPFLSEGYVYNFWQDHEHVQGIWRRALLEDYRKDQPTWETIIDLDQLS